MPHAPVPHSSLIVMLGSCILALELQIVHLWQAIDGTAHILVWAINIGLGILLKTNLTDCWQQLKADTFSSPIQSLFTLALLFSALLNLTGRAGVGDIGDYHLQAIQWNEHYPGVYGLGNLRRQLANNSNWFLLHAFAGCWFLGLKSVYVLNALLLFLAGIYCFPRKGDTQGILKATVLLYLCLMAFRKYVGAVTNDYVVTIFILILFTEWLKPETNKNPLLLLLILLFLPTFKLSAMALLLMVAGMPWLISKQPQQIKQYGCLILVGLLVYIPWFITNIRLSGYLVYPIPAIDWFAVDWKMRPETLTYELNLNKAMERVPGMDIMQVLQMPFSQWFPQWLKHLDSFSLLLLLLFFGGALTYLLLSLLVSRFRSRLFSLLPPAETLCILITTIAALVLWFVNAPATRFVFGYLVFGIACMLQLAFTYFNKTVSGKFPSRLIGLCMALLLVNGALFVRQYLPAEKLQASLISPLPYSTDQLQKVELSTGNFIYSPQPDKQCWDCPLPCTSIIDSSLQWRGSELEEGFRLKGQ
jgi:hypothetical protein